MAPITAFKMAAKMAAEISNYAQICQLYDVTEITISP